MIIKGKLILALPLSVLLIMVFVFVLISPDAAALSSTSIKQTTDLHDGGYYQITFSEVNSALGAVRSSYSEAAAGTEIILVASAVPGNRFLRWESASDNVVFNNPESPNTSFTMPSSDVEIAAIFVSGAGVIAENNVFVHYTQDDFAIRLDLPRGKIAEIIAAAATEVLVIDLTLLSDVRTIHIPRDALIMISNQNFGVEFRTTSGSITFNRAATASFAAQGFGATVTVNMNTISHSDLSDNQKQQILSADDLVYYISVFGGQQQIMSFDGRVTVVVPYVGRFPAAVWRMFDDGRLEDVPAAYDDTKFTVTFMPSSLSLFVVGYDAHAVGAGLPPDLPEIPFPIIPVPFPAENPFEDVRPEDWFYGSVRFVNSRNLMGGTSYEPMLFSPNENLTRAMLVTILYRREGMPASSLSENPFSDVSERAWYAPAVFWAVENGVVSGYGGYFSPNSYISRQDLAVVLMRYADYLGIRFPVVTFYHAFADENRISVYARRSVRWAVEAGIMGGTDVNRFAPLDNATRAQTAVMLHRFIDTLW